MDNLKEKVIEAKDIFGDQAIDIIVSDLELQDWDDSKKSAVCPFHTKDGHSENTPSFMWNPKDNAFKCFGCGKRYGILDHYQNMGKSFKQSVKELFLQTGVEYEFSDSTKRDYVYPKPELELTNSKSISYLKRRKLNLEALQFCGMKQDNEGNLAFEYYNEDNVLEMVKYRYAKKIKKGENKSWCQKDADTSHLLWGVDKVVYGRPLVITEGELDRVSVVQAGYKNVVSIPFGANNYHWIEYNWDFLNNFDEIIVCGDNDEAGKRMMEEVIPRLGEWRCKVLKYPNDDKGRHINDMNEILYKLGEERLIYTLTTAMDVPIKNVVDLADVEEMDLENAIGIKTGIKEIDRKLGKLYLGTLSVWTGINGSGKSTLLNQFCVAEPTNQGFKSFVFSGELSAPQLRNWIEYPMAGSNNINEYNSGEDQPTFYKVKPKQKELMREWYRGKIFLYDNELDKSAKTLLDKMEMMARKHGVKNFLIDNLMTVDISSYKGASIFEKQKEFVLDLVRFAIRFNVVVNLVAHPRKLDFIKRLTKMDVSGTGDITNLAHYVWAIHRVTKQEKEGIQNGKGDYVTEPIEFDMILDLFKNRPIGYQDIAFGMFFDRKSKRFYKTNDELYKKYGWDKQPVSCNDLENTPFD